MEVKKLAVSSKNTLTDPKLKRNAICTDWPGYFLKCPNTLIINSKGVMTLSKNSIGNPEFASKVVENCSSPGGGKPIKTKLKYGMSKDTPFETPYTEMHPSTKRILNT